MHRFRVVYTCEPIPRCVRIVDRFWVFSDSALSMLVERFRVVNRYRGLNRFHVVFMRCGPIPRCPCLLNFPCFFHL